MQVPAALAALGWDAERDRSTVVPEGHRVARVTRVDRSGYDVGSADGPERATASGAILADIASDATNAPCVGDWVLIRTWPDERTTLEAVLERRTFVLRAVSGRASVAQVLAANVDVVAVVEPLHPEPDLARLERLLALAFESGADPVVVLTKADLVPDADLVAEDVRAIAAGSPVLVLSRTDAASADRLGAYAGPGRTLALLGPSGAGKSTLTNLLAGATIMPTRALRGDGKGRHTTAHRELVLLPGGGVVIDTPGLRQVGLFAAEDGLDQVFADIAELSASCRFSDCRHDREPGCAVLAAVDAGALEPRRLESWRKLERELAAMARRTDARLRATQLARWKLLREQRRHRPG